MYVILFLLLALLTAALIVWLHREQRRKRAEIVERTAPLAAVDLAFTDPPLAPPATALDAAALADVPVFTATVATPHENWQEQVRVLRDAQQDAAALQVCRQQFPRIQALQQAAVILRHLIRTRLEANLDSSRELRELYRIAVMADLYRASNAVKPKHPRRSFEQLQQQEFDYQSIGTRQLRLLTKSDQRHLEQLWGRPERHRHAEDCPGLNWPRLCE